MCSGALTTYFFLIIGVDQDIPERPDQQANRPDVHLASYLSGPPPAAHWRISPFDAEGEELRREDEQNVAGRLGRIRSVFQFRVSEIFVPRSTFFWHSDRRWCGNPAQRTASPSNGRFHGRSSTTDAAANYQVNHGLVSDFLSIDLFVRITRTRMSCNTFTWILSIMVRWNLSHRSHLKVQPTIYQVVSEALHLDATREVGQLHEHDRRRVGKQPSLLQA